MILISFILKSSIRLVFRATGEGTCLPCGGSSALTFPCNARKSRLKTHILFIPIGSIQQQSSPPLDLSSNAMQVTGTEMLLVIEELLLAGACDAGRATWAANCLFGRIHRRLDALDQRSSRSARRQDLPEGPLAPPRQVSAASRFYGPVGFRRWWIRADSWTWAGWMHGLSGG